VSSIPSQCDGNGGVPNRTYNRQDNLVTSIDVPGSFGPVAQLFVRSERGRHR